MNEKKLNVCIIGTGYVGLTTGVCLAMTGHHVTCIDTNEHKIEVLKQGHSPIYEPGMEDLLRISSENLAFSTHYAACREADIIILAVGTPQTHAGNADLSFVEAAAHDVAHQLSGDKLQVIVNKSTVPIGTGLRVKLIINTVLEQRQKEANFAIASNPEFLREGVAIQDTLYPDRIVIGTEDKSALALLKTMYTPLLEQTFYPPSCCPRREGYPLPPLVATDVTSAEMIKYAANAFLATKISFINEIGGLCEKVGADVAEVARGIGLDTRIGSRFLQAGVGWGGSCFAKDTSALIATGQEYGYRLPIVTSAVEVNHRQRHRVLEKLQESLKVIRGRTIGLLGLSFKPDTDDLRDAPSLYLIDAISSMGARVKVYDPIAMDNCKKMYPKLPVKYTTSPVALAKDCDAVILVTEWQEFRVMEIETISAVMSGAKVFVDARNMYNKREVESVGLQYVGFGR